MNRRNARMNAFAVEQLQLCRSDRVLEIGFGGGVNLPALIENARYVTGLDPSPDMVRLARSKFAEAVKVGRADFRLGRVEALPLEDGEFAKVCTVNTVYFWKSLDAGFAEIYRVLIPGGRIVVGFLPKLRMDRMGMPRDIFTPRTAEQVVDAMSHAGFKRVRVCRPQPGTPWNAIVATR
jgi:arsenite methyltransferase